MSFEVEYSWQPRPFEYIHLKVTGTDEREFDQDLTAVNHQLLAKLAAIHANGFAVLNGHAQINAVPKAEPAKGTEIPLSAADLITAELGGKVIEETTNAKPWERPKPATIPNLFG